MRMKWGQDMATAALFIVIGLGAWLIGKDYAMGTPQRPGTGVLPAILAWCLVGSGLILGFKALVGKDQPMSTWAWRQLLLVTLAVVAFGLLVDDFGLVIAMIVSMTLCAMATLETRWQEFAIFSVIMLAIGVGTFIWLLGMPIPALPKSGFLSSIFR